MLIAVPAGVLVALVFSWVGIPLAIKIYGFPALLCFVFVIFSLPIGLIKRDYIFGQILFVAGVCSWAGLSIMGLGNAG